MSDLSRRDFIKLARDTFLYLSSALALGGMLRFLDYQPDPAAPSEFDLGPAENYPLNSTTLVANIPAVLLHTDEGFSALSLICTHLGCTVEPQDQGYACPCHGSRYDSAGRVIKGPAKKSLQSLIVENNLDGRLIVYVS